MEIKHFLNIMWDVFKQYINVLSFKKSAFEKHLKISPGKKISQNTEHRTLLTYWINILLIWIFYKNLHLITISFDPSNLKRMLTSKHQQKHGFRHADEVLMALKM